MKNMVVTSLLVLAVSTVAIGEEVASCFGTEVPVTIDPAATEEYWSPGVIPNVPLGEVHRWKLPVWSPDGKWIAFAGSSSLNLVSVDGGEAICLAETFILDDYYTNGFNDISFSPDGKKIIYGTEMYDTERGSIISEEDKSADPAYNWGRIVEIALSISQEAFLPEV